MINALINLSKGRVAPPKQINFQKISKRRGEPSSIQNFMLQILGLYIKLFSAFLKKKNCYIIFRIWGGESKPVWNISENSSVLVARPVPKLCRTLNNSHPLSHIVAYLKFKSTKENIRGLHISHQSFALLSLSQLWLVWKELSTDLSCGKYFSPEKLKDLRRNSGVFQLLLRSIKPWTRQF